jgi:co-chaperonin GroES (HSP10)
MAKRLIPSLNRVLVERLVQPKKTPGGILLPETSKQVPRLLAVPFRSHVSAVTWSALVG